MKLLIVAGPTASGKTALAVELAQKLDGEVVSADSQQVYRYFDLGTAKPSREELAAVPHHLIDVVEPHEDFSAARFASLADEAIADIAARGRRVILCGGTGLYLRVLLHGVVAAPPRDEALRAKLELLSSEALHAKLMEVDPVTAARLPVADRVRMIRALEIHALTGEPASTHREAHGFSASRYEYELLVLNPERQALYEAINARTQRMFDAGLIEETRQLVARGYRHTAPMKAVGYAQALEVLDGTMTEAEAIASTAQATRHYAKRQLTWFRKEQGARFVTTNEVRRQYSKPG